ncbi:MAG: tRNA (N6-isopentenyl adenosine(37)-C2)-methylthiotransferase MiaB [Lentisphaeria bacterium]|nr:tRNA (N6-isopentenyl adenosine(37)-C2)-methylthiotransferase MiaB [Lentisphaeria bacterium]
MKVFIKTYGCQMNIRDSEAIAGMLKNANYEIVDHESKADILLFNTCSVREAAENKAIGKVGFMRKLKKDKPHLIIGILGCMAQSKGDELFERLPHLDFVLGTGQLHKLLDTVNSLVEERKQMLLTAECNDVLTQMGVHYNDGDTSNFSNYSSFIAITRGCNRFCSYCIVPYVRGREISRTIEDVVAEAQELVASGTKEITLLGQNVAAFGLGGNVNPPEEGISPFADLLVELNKIEGLERIRFTSPYVSYFNDKLIQTMADCKKICHNIHLPMQSGSNRILKLMNRQYTREMYLEKVAKMRALMPDITFSTDIIVGFPGETEEDFMMTKTLMEEVGYDNAYIFKYSPRKGTKAAAMDDQISQEIKEERNQILLQVLRKQVESDIKKLLGTTQELLVEGVTKTNKDRFFGKTDTSWVVNFVPNAETKVGDIVKVKITQANAVTAVGELV